MNNAKILIVDDIPENISILFEFLSAQGFEISIAADGESALEVVEHSMPDLILLDVMMPGIDGFETCRRLKANKTFRKIPVIFMTALSDTADKVKGFKEGAVDYVTKPIQHDEVLARIKAHIALRKLNSELEKQNNELKSFSHTVAHDLKGPLGVVGNAVYLLKRDLGEDIQDAAAANLDLINKSVLRLNGIIEGLLTLADLSQQDAVFEPLNMKAIVALGLDRLQVMRRKKAAEVVLPDEWPISYGHRAWVEEIWVNYISNAIKHGGDQPRVELGATLQGDRVRFWARDNGPGLSPEQQALLFVPFTDLRINRAERQGLGLTVVQRIVEKLGGECGVESEQGKGGLFYFTLPATQHTNAD